MTEQRPRKRPRVNNAIYITGLPATIGQLQLEDAVKGPWKVGRVKIYRDDSGLPKGDALITLHDKTGDVVARALQELDGREVDQGALGVFTISASRAEFSDSGRLEEDASTDVQPPNPPAKSARGDIGPAVILHNLFDPSLPRDGSSFFTDLENEVRGECAKHGEIISVEAQPTAGSICIRFVSELAASACAKVMDSRWFDERLMRSEFLPAAPVAVPAAAPAPVAHVAAAPAPVAHVPAASAPAAHVPAARPRSSPQPAREPTKSIQFVKATAPASAPIPSPSETAKRASATSPIEANTPGASMPHSVETADSSERASRVATSDYSSLSIKELKQRLDDLGVPRWDCCEKSDLVAKLQQWQPRS